MTTIKNVLLWSLLVFIAPFAKAQTAEWLVPPQYNAIEYIAPGIYKVAKDGKTGIIGADGEIKVSVEYDEIKSFYEGLAIFGNYTTEGFLLKGVLSETGSVEYASEPYYLLRDFPFYSEGFIPVREESGRYGYLNEKCRPAFPFSNDETRPFSEGNAAVGEGDNFHYLTTSGEKIYLELPNGAYPYGGTNYYNGRAYLWDQDGDFFLLNENGSINKISERKILVDYLYREESDKGLDVTYSFYKPTSDRLWVPSQRDGLWTYLNAEGKPLTPFQYGAVNNFSDGKAMASVEGKWGLLHIVDDYSSFFTKADKRRYVFTPGDDCTCQFRLSVPDKWKNEKISVILKDKDSGNQIALEPDNNLFRFAYKPESGKTSEEKTFKIEVRDNDIPLWQGEEMFTFIQRIKLSSAIRVNNADANSDDLCYVTATVKNPSSIAVTTTVTLSGGGNKAHFDNKTVTVTIPPYGSKSITSAFRVKNVELGGWCSVTTSDGTSARRSNLELKPF